MGRVVSLRNQMLLRWRENLVLKKEVVQFWLTTPSRFWPPNRLEELVIAKSD